MDETQEGFPRPRNQRKSEKNLDTQGCHSGQEITRLYCGRKQGVSANHLNDGKNFQEYNSKLCKHCVLKNNTKTRF